MTDYFLKFPDEATGFTACRNAGLTAEIEAGTSIVCFTHSYALDVIGEIVLPPQIDSDGNVLVTSQTLTGWHMNYRSIDGSNLPSEFQPYTITVVTPYRFWA